MSQKKSLTREESKTIKWYDDQAETWAQKHGLNRDKSLMFQPEMNILFKLVPQGKVLEIGTGHGGDAIQLINHYGVDNYIGVDASSGLLEIAKSRNPTADLRLCSIYDLDFSNEFDAFWASAVLIHIPKNKLQLALDRLKEAIKTAGIGFISVMEGSADMDESRPGRHYSLWSKDEFERELFLAGFEIIHHRKIKEPGNAPWLTYLIKKVILS